jgi:hypothetical protein
MPCRITTGKLLFAVLTFGYTLYSSYLTLIPNRFIIHIINDGNYSGCHCECSEAIPNSHFGDCFVAKNAPRNDRWAE